MAADLYGAAVFAINEKLSTVPDEETVYPPTGLGPGTTQADKAVQGLKVVSEAFY